MSIFGDVYWNQIIEENCLLIGGEPGSAKTSLAAGFIVPKISQAYESEVIVLDSHAKKNNWESSSKNTCDIP